MTMLLWTGITILALGVIAGIFITTQHARGQNVTDVQALAHGVGATVGTALVLLYLSSARSWNISHLREGIATSLVMAGLIGCLLGLLRLADQKFSSFLLVVHVGFGLMGIGLIGWFLYS